MKIQSLISVLLFVVGGAVAAQTVVPANSTGTPGLIKREGLQQQRINQGIASGQLNQREVKRLQARENKLANDVATAKVDGKVTKKERALLNREANRDSRAIYRQKHDLQQAKPTS